MPFFVQNINYIPIILFSYPKKKAILINFIAFLSLLTIFL
jgi:hypothetical protein